METEYTELGLMRMADLFSHKSLPARRNRVVRISIRYRFPVMMHIGVPSEIIVLLLVFFSQFLSFSHRVDDPKDGGLSLLLNVLTC